MPGIIIGNIISTLIMSGKSIVVRLKDIEATSNLILNPAFWIDNSEFIPRAKKVKTLRITRADILLIRHFKHLLRKWGVNLPEEEGEKVTQLERKAALLNLRSRKRELVNRLEVEVTKLQDQISTLQD